MPGLLGFYDETITPKKGKERLNQLIDLLTHQSFYEHDNLFVKDGVYGSRSHKNFVQKNPQPFSINQVHVWFDGEIYNRNSFGAQYEDVTDPEFIASLYKENKTFSFLKEIDGIFSIVIFDAIQKKIYFITDRHGFKLLYCYEDNERLAWFSEAKGALALDYYSTKIDTDSVHDFFNQGYLTGNKSWFKGVKLFSPATVTCWDISKKTYSKHYTYWSWKEIQTLDRNLDEKGIIERMGTLFKTAVRKRAYPTDEICIPLSGGLDSRAIVAAFPNSKKTLHTYTFGKPDCWDIQIARKVSQLRGANHRIVELNEINWFDNRTEGIWWTDGQMNLKHMHVLKLLEAYSKNFKVSLNGFLGAAIMGGYYLEDGQTSFSQKIINRGRRFINEGSRLGEAFGVFYRRPYIDNDLLEYTLSLPTKLRKKSYLYNRMLLNEFPDYFLELPWQRTGKAISTSRIMSAYNKKTHALRNRVVHMLKSIGIPYNDNKHYHNYPDWIRESSNFVNSVLRNPKAIYPEYISREQVLKNWKDQLNGKDRSEEICAYLTFEIFLQQVFMNKHRPKI